MKLCKTDILSIKLLREKNWNIKFVLNHLFLPKLNLQVTGNYITQKNYFKRMPIKTKTYGEWKKKSKESLGNFERDFAKGLHLRQIRLYIKSKRNSSSVTLLILTWTPRDAQKHFKVSDNIRNTAVKNIGGSEFSILSFVYPIKFKF